MKIIFSLLMILIVISNVKAQDMITLKNGDQIKCKVTEVGVTEIKYKKENTPDATVYVIDKNTVLVINYEDGTKDVLNDISINSKKNENVSDESATRKGIYLGLYTNPSLTYLKLDGVFSSYNGQILNDLNEKASPNILSGISLGFYPINEFGVSTGLNYTMLGTTMSIGQDVAGNPINLKEIANYISIPIALSFIVGKPNHLSFYFDIGPQLGFLVSASEKRKATTTLPVYTTSTKDSYNSTQLFFNATAGINIPYASNKMSVDIGPYFNTGTSSLLKSGFMYNSVHSYVGGITIHIKSRLFSM